MANGGRAVQAQGSAFEQLFQELLNRVVAGDLGLEVVENSLQPAGTQYGRDLRFVYRDSLGRTNRWHFECKSHREGSIPWPEVGPKLDQSAASGESADVWCLTIAHARPTPETSRLLARADSDSSVPFAVEVLSVERGSLRELFACYPDLFADVYNRDDAPNVEPSERVRRVNRFGLWLSNATDRGRSKGLPRGWELLSPARVLAEGEAPSAASRYLRGLYPVPPWQAAAHGWSIERSSTLDPLVDRIRNADVGSDALCLLGAGGEGKSTVLRQLAWRIARDEPDAAVLWADRGDARVGTPIEWILRQRPGARVLVCLDDLPESRAVEDLARRAHDVERHELRVVVVAASRVAPWLSSSTRNAARRITRGAAEITLEPLVAGERAALVDAVSSRGLLHAFDRDEALALIDREAAQPQPDRGWLLPILMQLTDREGRRFEAILGSILRELDTQDRRGALKLLLAAAMTHASGIGLPETIARNLVQDDGGFAQASQQLMAELETQLDVGALPELGTSHAIFTHHQVIAEALVTEAADAPDLRIVWLEVCRGVPEAVAPHVDEDALIPPNLFDVLDAVADDLRRRHRFEELATLYESWIGLDDRQWPAWHRLGVCYSDWLYARSRHDATREEIARLATGGRTAFKQALAVLNRVLGGSAANVPIPFRKFHLGQQRHYIYQSTAVLENRIAAALDSRRAALRGALLSLLSLPDGVDRGGGRLDAATGLAALAFALILLDRQEAAAQVVAACERLGGDLKVVNDLADRLSEAGIPRVQPQLDGVDRALAELCREVLLPEWEVAQLFPDEERFKRVLGDTALKVARWLPSADQIERLFTDR